jgi:hypothetical protein
MRGSLNDIPVAFEGMGVVLHQAEWGDMNVGLESFPAGMDLAPIFRGLPDDRCACPHWGYVVKGKIRARYANHEEIFTAGDAYHLTPGHTLSFDEDTELVEFSPRVEYQKTMEVAAQNVAALQAGV